MTQTSPSVPAKVVPASVPSLKKDGEVYVFKAPEIQFLREYSSSLDEDLALAQLPIDQRRKSEILQNPHVREEMAKIQQAWRYRGRLTQEFAGGNHARLMQKFEQNYDQLETGNKPKMAGVLAKMSEATMKATGLIGSERDQALPTVIINMNMGEAENVAVQVNQVQGQQEGTSDGGER